MSFFRILFFGILLLFSYQTNAQETIVESKTIDSLIMRLSVLEEGEEKADVLLAISSQYSNQDCKIAKEYANLSLSLAKKIDYKKGEFSASIIIGKYFLNCDAVNVVALSHYNNAMKIANELGDSEMELTALENIAFVNFQLKEYDIAIDYYNKSIELALNIDSLGGRAKALYGYLGNVYLSMKDTTTCLVYYQMILVPNSKSKIIKASPQDLLITADYYLLKKEYGIAEKYAFAALHKLEKQTNYTWLSYANYYCGVVKLAAGDANSAIEYAKKGLKIAENRKLNKERLDNYNLLAKAYKKLEDYKNTEFYLEKFYNLNDSLNMQEQQERRLQYQRELDNSINQRENEKTKSELRTKELESKNDQLLIYAITIGLIVTFILLFFLYRKLRKGNRLLLQLEEQKQQLTKLSVVAANIDQMVMIVGKDDKIEWVNNAFEKKFGYRKFETINCTPYDLLAGENTRAEDIKDINRRIFKERVSFNITLWQYTKTNESVLTDLSITPILDKKGKLLRYVVLSRDITDEQEKAEELKELSLVANNTTNSIVIFNSDLEVVWVNSSFTTRSGKTAENAIGETIEELYEAIIISKEKRLKLIEGYRSNKEFSIEFEGENMRNGTKYWVAMSATPVFDDNGNIVKVISISTDISNIKNMEKQYTELIEDSVDMIYELDLNGFFVFANDVLVNRSGYSKEELKSVFYLDLVRADYKKIVGEFYKNQVVSLQNSSYLEFPIEIEGKECFWVGVVSQLKLNDAGDDVLGFKAIARDISEQKKVEDKLKLTYSNVSLLSKIGMQITSTHSVNEIINKVYGNVNKLMDANVFGIAMPDKKNENLVFPLIIEKGEPIMNSGFSLMDETRLGVICFKESKEIIINDFHKEISEYLPGMDVVAPVAGEQSVSTVYVPLILKNKTVGVLTVQSFKPFAYDENQLNLIRSMAIYVAIAIENASLYATMEEKIAKRTELVRKQKEELEVNYFNTNMLSQIGQLVSSTLDLDEIFEEVYSKVGQLMDAEILGVLIPDEKQELILYKYAIENGVRLKPFSVSMSKTNNYAVWCWANRKELLINDNENEHKNYIDTVHVPKGEYPQSLLFYPMIVENKLVGVITIQSFKSNAYQKYHLDILKTLASYIGTTIDNSILYDTLENKVQERTIELEQKNNDITASINYAKRLQKGILPKKSFMQRLLPDSFVLFKPKDIVSGDFYWVDRTNTKILFAVVDCTGHGVPGAMMSIIGRNLLDQAVNEKGITRPSQILNFLQVGLSLAFGQTGERKADLFDGMDLSLCSLDYQTKTLEFAGANTSLYLIQEGELLAIKGDRVGISAEYEISNSYTNLEIEIEKGDVIYLTSDGFPDQFGGDRYKKFTSRRMQDLFRDIHKLEMSEQYDIVKQKFIDWKGDKGQTDDVCVMGIKI